MDASRRSSTRSTPSLIDFKTRLACFLSPLPPFAAFALFFATHRTFLLSARSFCDYKFFLGMFHAL